MHLTINQGMGNTWNLIWQPYQGFVVSSYNIYRGTTPNYINDVTPHFNFSVFPNPASSFINIQHNGDIQSDKQFSIFNAQGQQVKIGSGLQNIDLTPLSNGVYFIQFDHYNQKIRLKFILQR